MIPFPGLKGDYARIGAAPPESDKRRRPDDHLTLNYTTPGHGLWAWLDTVWPLVLHFIGALTIATLLMYYVDGNHFNVRERMPAVPLADGTIVQTTRFSPLQSDINTILSASLVVLRWIVAAWAGPLCSRALFFLMEKTGLRRKDLEWLIGYGLFPPSTYLRNAFIIIVAAILTSNLFAQSASPILTGSITWTPAIVPAMVHSDASINVKVARIYSNFWQAFRVPYKQTTLAVKAAGYANQAWGRDIQKGVLKRVLPSAAMLNINSTIANVTLPYFRVTALEWISDPQTYNITGLNFDGALGVPYQSALIFGDTPGMVGILPNAWRGVPNSPNGWPFPPPSTVSETRTLILNAGEAPRILLNNQSTTSCEGSSWRISQSFPQDTGFLNVWSSCVALAQVTYTAGASVCTNCRLSSPSTVQSESDLALEPDTMTTEALWNMLNVTTFLLLMNTSVPSPWPNVDDYVAEVLFRSYSGAWSALHEVMNDADDPPLTSRVYPTLQSLQAQLDLRRVYAWLALQLLVTFAGIFFLWLQSRSKFALIGDTTMAVFDLDTTDAKPQSLLKIEPKDDGWKVSVTHDPH